MVFTAAKKSGLIDMRDIAKSAEVFCATVSRVINVDRALSGGRTRIVRFDDIELSDIVYLPLTTLRLPRKPSGRG